MNQIKKQKISAKNYYFKNPLKMEKNFEAIDRALCRTLKMCDTCKSQKFTLSKISKTKLKNSLNFLEEFLKTNNNLPELKILEINSYIRIASNLLWQSE